MKKLTETEIDYFIKNPLPPPQRYKDLEFNEYYDYLTTTAFNKYEYYNKHDLYEARWRLYPERYDWTPEYEHHDPIEWELFDMCLDKHKIFAKDRDDKLELIRLEKENKGNIDDIVSDKASIDYINKHFKVSKTIDKQDDIIRQLYDDYYSCEISNLVDKTEWRENNKTRKEIKNILISDASKIYRDNMEL